MSKHKFTNDIDYIVYQIRELKKILNSNDKKTENQKPVSEKKDNRVSGKDNLEINVERSDTRVSGKDNLEMNSQTPETLVSKEVNLESSDINKNVIQKDILKKSNNQNSKGKMILDNLENQINILLMDNNNLRSDKLKALADLENYKKALNKEFEERKKYSISDFVNSLLPVLDNFERALIVENVSDSVKNFLTGFDFINQNIKEVFRRYGILEIKTQIGDEYNSHIHNAIEVIETQKVKTGTIAKVLSKGYKLHDRVIKPVLVNIEK